ncbi:MAG TPA: hypothetical protein VG963_08075 [Polyangiaceae bacterium]|nr:hypothetical protein [Polyangiaceae bacterium]
MTSSDPPRWTESEEAPEPLRRLLSASRAELGSPAQVEALAPELARALGPAAGLGSPQQPEPSSPTQLPARGVVLRWLAPLAAATGVLALWWGSSTSRAPVASNTSSPATSTPLASARSAAPMVATRDVPAAGPAADTRAADPGDDRFAPDGTTPEGTTRAGAPRAVAAHLHGAASANEAALLEKARALLSGAPARALALTREHRRRFPHGALAEEREVIAIEALKLLGQERAAGDEADAFGAQYRNSVHRERLQQSPSR